MNNLKKNYNMPKKSKINKMFVRIKNYEFKPEAVIQVEKKVKYTNYSRHSSIQAMNWKLKSMGRSEIYQKPIKSYILTVTHATTPKKEKTVKIVFDSDDEINEAYKLLTND